MPKTAPVSDEMRCDNCHSDGGVGGVSTGDYRLNILTYHDNESGTNLVGSQPVLCASCHASKSSAWCTAKPARKSPR